MKRICRLPMGEDGEEVEEVEEVDEVAEDGAKNDHTIRNASEIYIGIWLGQQCS